MDTMNFSLPDPMKAFIETQAAEEGYGSVSEYLCSVIRDVQKRKAKQKLEAKLLEGMEGPFSEMTPEDWEALKREAMKGLEGEIIQP